MERPDDGRRRALAAAGLVGGLVTGAAYLGQRLFDHARGRAADAAMVIASLHTDFYYRVAVALWVGGGAALFCRVVWDGGLSGVGSARVARGVAVGAPLFGLLAVLIAWAFP